MCKLASSFWRALFSSFLWAGLSLSCFSFLFFCFVFQKGKISLFSCKSFVLQFSGHYRLYSLIYPWNSVNALFAQARPGCTLAHQPPPPSARAPRSSLISVFTFNKQQMNCAQLYDNYLPCISWSNFFCNASCCCSRSGCPCRCCCFCYYFTFCLCFVHIQIIRSIYSFWVTRSAHTIRRATHFIMWCVCVLFEENLLVSLCVLDIRFEKWKIINYKRLHFTTKISRLVACFIVFISLPFGLCFYFGKTVGNCQEQCCCRCSVFPFE